MLNDLAKNPAVRLAAGVIIVVVLASFFFHPGRPHTPVKEVKRFIGRLQEAVGFVTAQEAAKLLGDSGGKVAIMLPPITRDMKLETSLSGAYERGFTAAAKDLPKLKVAGHFLANWYTPETPHDYSLPSLETYQAARQAFPDVDLVVSFMGPPDFKPGEGDVWLNATPPKIMAVERAPISAALKAEVLQSGMVQELIIYRHEVPFPTEEPKGEFKEIFDRYYQVVNP